MTVTVVRAYKRKTISISAVRKSIAVSTEKADAVTIQANQPYHVSVSAERKSYAVKAKKKALSIYSYEMCPIYSGLYDVNRYQLIDKEGARLILTNQ